MYSQSRQGKKCRIQQLESRTQQTPELQAYDKSENILQGVSVSCHIRQTHGGEAVWCLDSPRHTRYEKSDC